MTKLTPREQEKYIVIRDYKNGKITRRQASIKLNVSVVTITRLKRELLQYGKNAFIHKNKGRSSEKHIDKDIESRIVKLYQDKYTGFNFSHFYEMLEEYEDVVNLPSQRTVYNLLFRNNVTSPQAKRKRKKNNQHPIRKRRSAFGELIQLDASVHDWFENGKKSNLHLAIDDSTSILLAGHFEEQETLHGYFAIKKQILNKYGVPSSYYTDNRATFIFNSGKSDTDANIQFKRVCNGLGIELITASTPQAKDRVERSFGTHQDRLISEFRLHKIKTIDDANIYLQKYIIRHNKKFAFEQKTSAFRALDKDADIDKMVCSEYERKILNGNVISYNSKQYIPLKKNGEFYILEPNTRVDVVITYDGQILIKHNQKYYEARFMREGRSTAHSPSRYHP